jgi:hypothetical protein
MGGGKTSGPHSTPCEFSRRMVGSAGTRQPAHRPAAARAPRTTSEGEFCQRKSVHFRWQFAESDGRGVSARFDPCKSEQVCEIACRRVGEALGEPTCVSPKAHGPVLLAAGTAARNSSSTALTRDKWPEKNGADRPAR